MPCLAVAAFAAGKAALNYIILAVFNGQSNITVIIIKVYSLSEGSLSSIQINVILFEINISIKNTLNDK